VPTGSAIRSRNFYLHPEIRQIGQVFYDLIADRTTSDFDDKILLLKRRIRLNPNGLQRGNTLLCDVGL
jgi:hypothetical protein